MCIMLSSITWLKHPINALKKLTDHLMRTGNEISSFSIFKPNSDRYFPDIAEKMASNDPPKNVWENPCRCPSPVIVSPNVNSGTNVQVYNMFSSGGSEKYNDFETVNFLFAKVNSAPVLLLESHALVLEYHLITIEPKPKSFNRAFKTNKHLFSVILTDDNQDKVLDKKDKINLLASDHDGANLVTIAKDINDYEIIDDNLLLITQFKEEKTIILIYDLQTGTSNTLNTHLPISQVSNMTN